MTVLLSVRNRKEKKVLNLCVSFYWLCWSSFWFLFDWLLCCLSFIDIQLIALV
jgi:hypothetical protein